MREREAPRLERRRAKDFERELVARARAWIPNWSLDEDPRDFGRALLRIAALFESEVAERLDKVGDKMRRGFLDWLAISREAARPARLPVALKLTDSAAEPVLADARAQLQADAEGAAVMLETEAPVLLLPGSLARVIAADAGDDKFFEAPPGFTSLDPVEPLPAEWRVKSFAAGGQDKLQLDSELGLDEGLIVAIEGAQYELRKVDKDIVTVDPKLPAGVAPDTLVSKVTTFAPFEAGARNLQKHALYIGHPDALNLEAAATIEVFGASGIGGEQWSFWGKPPEGGDPDWQALTPGPQKAGAVVLEKPAGSVEPRDVGTVKGMRWLRAMKVTSAAPFVTEEVTLRINAKDGGPCPKAGDAPCPDVKAEAMANATPLTMTSAFFPLGRQPKQFDAFYLGCEEAFSKAGAKVCLNLEIANATFKVLAAYKDNVLAGVGRDRSLHVYSLDPFSGAITPFEKTEALQPSGVALDPSPAWRPPVWTTASGFAVAVAAGAGAYVWQADVANENNSKWESFDAVPDPSTPIPNVAVPPIDGLAYVAEGLKAIDAPVLVALRGREISCRKADKSDAWTRLSTTSAGADIGFLSIASVRGAGLPAVVAPADATDKVAENANPVRLVGVGGTLAADRSIAQPKLYAVGANGDCTEIGSNTDLDGSVPPVASFAVVAVGPPAEWRLVAAGAELQAAAPLGVGVHEVGIKTIPGTAGANATISTTAVPAQYPFAGQVLGLDFSPDGTRVVASLDTNDVVAIDIAGGSSIVNPIAPSLLEVGGAPTIAGSRIVVPGTKSDAAEAVWDPSLRLTGGPLSTGIVVPSNITLNVNESIVVADQVARITNVGFPRDNEAFYPVTPTLPLAAAGSPVFLVESAPPFGGQVSSSTTTSGGVTTTTLTLVLDAADGPARDGQIFVEDKVYAAKAISSTDVELQPAAVVTGGLVPYAWVREIGGRAVMFTSRSLLAPWDKPTVEDAAFRFTSAGVSAPGRGKIFGVPGAQPATIVLEPLAFAPGLTSYVADASIGAWRRRLGDTASNPELSWEYWNGTGWSSLPGVRDDTFNFKSTGTVTFSVPATLVQGDWAGKKNHWIRARLVGGDYGQEQITVITEDVGTGSQKKQKQTIEKSTEGVRPPSIVSLHICYGLYDPVMPKHVLAEDSGTVRDQSDANRTPRAVVEAFVPLSWTLGRLERAVRPPTKAEGICPPPPCGCGDTDPGAQAGAAAPDSTVPATGRFLFLGFSRALSGSSVNVLLTVASERDFDAIAPANTASVVEGRFQAVTTSDTTRAMGETGLLTLSFPQGTTATSLFGESRHWLRVRPRGTTADWSPVLGGAYLNAVWASARETLTRELLGSSEGAPDLVVKVARPPVLRDTLELRVREPLGDEERVALEQAGLVLTEGDPAQHWVLWTKVADPLDHGPTDRVYALDELTGEIRFGNGRRGAIPPVGRDSIVAFTYARTETLPGATTVPANAIRARASLNVVSPVDSVEAAYAVLDAGGGAPSEPDERVLHYGSARLRHRDRAVTLRDFEDIALQGSPELAQARAFPRGAGVRLVVVARGRRPMPGRSAMRELRARLLAAAPASLDPEAFTVVGPRLRHARVVLTLRILDLALAGPVEKALRGRLERYFDTAEGGGSGQGLALGAMPIVEDIARAIAEHPALEGIASIEVLERGDKERDQSLPARIAGDELFVLDADGVRFEFQVAGAAA